MYKKYDEIREAYLEKFGVEAQDYMPLEIPYGIEDMEEALKTGIALPQILEDTVT